MQATCKQRCPPPQKVVCLDVPDADAPMPSVDSKTGTPASTEAGRADAAGGSAQPSGPETHSPSVRRRQSAPEHHRRDVYSDENLLRAPGSKSALGAGAMTRSRNEVLAAGPPVTQQPCSTLS